MGFRPARAPTYRPPGRIVQQFDMMAPEERGGGEVLLIEPRFRARHGIVLAPRRGPTHCGDQGEDSTSALVA